MKILTILLLGLTIFACHRTQTIPDKITSLDTISKIVAVKDPMHDKITELLDKALTLDTLEYNNQFEFNTSNHFLFFKSGHIISKSEKSAIGVVCPTDTTCMVKLYSIENNKWILSDSITGLEAFPIQFDLIFDDYNFDGQTDIYIQVSASNGWSLSRGHLLIIETKSKKFDLHKETREFANMTPDIETKTVKTELWNGFDLNGLHHLTIFTNKWINGQLKTIGKKDIKIKPE